LTFSFGTSSIVDQPDRGNLALHKYQLYLMNMYRSR
jgi:hypothetical protein